MFKFIDFYNRCHHNLIIAFQHSGVKRIDFIYKTNNTKKPKHPIKIKMKKKISINNIFIAIDYYYCNNAQWEIYKKKIQKLIKIRQFLHEKKNHIKSNLLSVNK